MDDKTKYGFLGEMKALTYFTQEGYFVFKDLSGKAPVDLIILKDNIMQRVECKSCIFKRDGKYIVHIKRNKRDFKKSVPFNSDSCDILFVYFPLDNTHIIIPSNKIKSKTSITINNEYKATV